MIIKILGFADILAIIALITASILPTSLVILMALYLIIKGIVFMALGGSLPSFFDIICGVYLISTAYGISHWIITVIVLIYLLQKAIISLF